MDFEKLKLNVTQSGSFIYPSADEAKAINAALSEAARLQRACDEFVTWLISTAEWLNGCPADAASTEKLERGSRAHQCCIAWDHFKALRASAAPGEGTPRLTPMTERDEYDEIAIRTEAETAPSAALSASDQQADRRLLARSIGFALRQHAATKRCASCQHWVEYKDNGARQAIASAINVAPSDFPVLGDCQLIQVAGDKLTTGSQFGCTLFAPWTPER